MNDEILEERKKTFKESKFDSIIIEAMDNIKKMEDYSCRLRKEKRAAHFCSIRTHETLNTHSEANLNNLNPLLLSHEVTFAEKLNITFIELQSSDTVKIDTLLSFLKELLIQTEVADLNIKPEFIFQLTKLINVHNEKITLNAMWALNNIIAVSSQAVNQIRSIGLQYKLIDMIDKGNENMKEQCLWLIGNITGDSIEARDEMLSTKLIGQITEIIGSNNAKLPILNVSCWIISNLCKGKPSPPLERLQPFVKYLNPLLYNKDEGVVSDVLWSLLYITDRERTAVKLVINCIDIAQVASFISSTNHLIKKAALIILGNISIGDEEDVDIVLKTKCLPKITNILNDEIYDEYIINASWMISSIAADTRNHNDELISSEIPKALITLVKKHRINKIRKKAFFALKNIIVTATPTQIVKIVDEEMIKSIIHALDTIDPDLLSILMGILECIMKCDKYTEADYITLFDLLGGKSKLEQLQYHGNIAIYKRSVNLLKRYYDQSEDDIMEIDNVLVNKLIDKL